MKGYKVLPHLIVMNIQACFSSLTDDWKTPSVLHKWFLDNGFIDCFPYQSDIDEFQNTYKNSYLFVNPPYSMMDRVANWVLKQLIFRNYIVLLVLCRTDTKWFQLLLTRSPVLYFFKGRLKFNDSNKCAPFPSCAMVFDGSSYYGFKFCNYQYGTASDFTTYISKSIHIWKAVYKK